MYDLSWLKYCFQVAINLKKFTGTRIRKLQFKIRRKFIFNPRCVFRNRAILIKKCAWYEEFLFAFNACEVGSSLENVLAIGCCFLKKYLAIQDLIALAQLSIKHHPTVQSTFSFVLQITHLECVVQLPGQHLSLILFTTYRLKNDR